MTIVMRKSICMILSFLGLCINIFAQNISDSLPSSSEKISQIYIETDPTTYFFNGFSLAVRRSATFHKKLNIGLGIYKTTIPDFYIEAEESNKNKGWKAKNLGIDGFFDYYFFNPNKGLSVGLTLSLYNFTIERVGIKTNYYSFIQTLRAGYLWRPFNKFDSVYIFPWIGISTNQKISGNNVIEGETFTTPKVSIVPSLQIGFSF